MLVSLSLTFFANAQHNDDVLAKQLVTKNAAAIGLSKDDLNNYFVSSSYFNQTGNEQLVYLLQGYKGLPVWNQMLVLSFRDGKLLSKAGGFLPNMDQLTSGRSATPSVSAVNAVRSAFTESNLAVPASITQRYTFDNGKKIDFGTFGMAKENITAELMWVPVMDGANMTAVKLAWQVQLFPLINSDYWNIRVDASNSSIVNKDNLTVYDVMDEPGKQYLAQDNFLLKDPEYFKKKPFVSSSPLDNIFSVTDNTKDQANSPNLVTTVNYTVIKYPAEAPSFPGGTAVVHTNPWTLAGGNAVTLGWQNDGALDYTVSRGNNVHAHEDQAANNSNLGVQASSTTTPDPLNFTYAGQPNYTVAPTTAGFQQFAITNLFYWNNICHDATYKYGFTEVSFNFQNNNLGRGGLGGDYVQADAQDGSGTNNANFATPPEGNRPRMQMFLFNPAPGTLTFVVNSPASIAGPYAAVESAFSPNNLLGNVGPRTANLVYYNDVALTTHEACVAPSNAAALNGKIALINRGTCNFTAKVLNAQAAGAIGVVMVNNAPGPPIVMGGGPDPTIITPAIMISDVDGATIAAQLSNPFVNVTMSSTPPGTVNLDGDIDNAVIAHEYFHGVSNRLTGGGTSTACLQNAEQGGEGWSDYNGLILTTDWSIALITDGFNKKRPIGTYVLGQQPTGAGIRLYPYSTNISINPLTYANMGVAPVGTEVHNIGEILCATLWDMTWNIIQTDGINPNFFDNTVAGGNSVAYKLVIEGLKLQGCSPGYIDVRNGILQADQNLYGGAHYCSIWSAFARRGMGFSASQGSSNSATDQTPAFDLPPAPTITAQPASVSVCIGANTSFSVTATGTNITYQWQLSTNGGGTWNNITNGAPYSGATIATLTVTGVTAGMNNNQYRCVLTGGCGNPAVNSNAATLTVSSGAPAITAQPANASICAGSNATFSVTATGTPLTYQWQESTNGGGTWNNITNGGIYSGATTATLTLTGVTTGMNNYQYRCVVTGGCGGSSVNTNAAILSVFTGGTAITSQPANASACAGGNASFSVTATGPGLTYQWQQSTNGGGTWTNITNGGIYSGATTIALTLTGVTAGMNNYQFRCIVTGSCPPAVTSNAAVLTVNIAPAITGQPSSTTVCTTTNASFTVTASGTALTNQWQESTNGGGTWNNITNGGIYSGATTATLTLTGVTVGMNGYQYRCVVSGLCSPSATSNAAILTVVTLSTGGTLTPANTVHCSAVNSGTLTLSGYTGNIIQWESATNIAGPWTIITNTTNTLTYSNLAVTTYYRVLVQASGCAGAYSSTATVTVAVDE